MYEGEVKRDFGTGERSTAYNDRHRGWGRDVPATDIDAIETSGGLSENNSFIEFSKHTGEREIYALMEIKAAPRERIGADYGKRQLDVLVMLACDRFPVFGVEWRTCPENDDATGAIREDWYFAVYAANDLARAYIGGMAACTMNERQYVRLLYRMRGLDAPAGIIEELPDLAVPKCFFVDAKNGVAQPHQFTGAAG